MKSTSWIVGAAATALLAGALGQSAQALGASSTAAEEGGVATGAAAPASPPSPDRAETPAAPAVEEFDTPKAPTWWKLQELDGREMRWNNFKKGPRAGQRVLRVVIGKQYILQGKVPSSSMHHAGKRLVLQAKADSGGPWTAVASARVAKNGRFKATVDITKRLQGVHKYRIVAPSVARASTQGTALPGPLLTASGDTSWSVIFTNDGGDDLVLAFPGAQDPSNGYYSSGTWDLPNNTASELTWVNPIEDQTGFSFIAQKIECFMGCNNFYANWNYGQGKYESCSTAMPEFTSGSTWNLRITGQDLDAGYDMYLIDDSGSVVCTGSLDTKFDNWLINHPVAKWLVITMVGSLAIDAATGLICAWAGFVGIDAAVTGLQRVVEGARRDSWNTEWLDAEEIVDL